MFAIRLTKAARNCEDTRKIRRSMTLNSKGEALRFALQSAHQVRQKICMYESAQDVCLMNGAGASKLCFSFVAKYTRKKNYMCTDFCTLENFTRPVWQQFIML